MGTVTVSAMPIRALADGLKISPIRGRMAIRPAVTVRRVPIGWAQPRQRRRQRHPVAHHLDLRGGGGLIVDHRRRPPNGEREDPNSAPEKAPPPNEGRVLPRGEG